MKTKRIYQAIALLAMALTTAACQNELNEDTTQPQTGEKVNMIIRATQGTTPQTRTEYEDKLGVGTAGNIVVKWEGGTDANATLEKIKVFGYAADATKLDYSVDFSSKSGSLSADGTSITFEGTIDDKAHYLTMYPADKCTYAVTDEVVYTSFLGQTQDCATTATSMKHLKDFDFMVGRPETAGKYDKFTFTHEATMIRFVLNLPSEKITKVSLSSTAQLYSQMYTSVDGTGAKVEIDTDALISSFDLDITGHTASATPLNAYMMMPPIDVSNTTLTITVATASGNNYEGKLQTGVDTKLNPGLCYTLTPTLALKTITVPPVTEEGTLGEALDKITLADGQTDLVVTGAVNEADITALAGFLKDEKSKNITLLDLSGIAIANSAPVAGFKDCTKVVKVILPDEAEAIGNNAFEGCAALTTVTQNETSAPVPGTRASMPKKVKTVGDNAFKGCTAMTEMFLHASITSVGANAFDGCTALQALVFEGDRTISTETGADKIKLGVTILANCTQKDLNILLPFIGVATKAATYKKALGKPTYYEYETYSTATDEDKVKPESYSGTVSDGSSVDDFKPGGPLGQ